MGWAKQRQIIEMERGYGSSDKVVCKNCVGDYYLNKYINDNGEMNTCDYCGSDDICVELEDLMEPIMNGIRQEYDYANNCMGYNGREGGFIGAKTYDSYDLIHDEIWDEFEFECDNLYDDVSNLISDSILWCQRDPYGSLQYDEDFYTWKMYEDAIKKYGTNIKFDKSFYSSMETYKHPSEILMRISEGIIQLGLIDDMKLDTPLWRARAHEKYEVVDSANELGSPREDKAGCNRMNPANVSTFYGASNKSTALHEIANQSSPIITIGLFYNQVPLKVINFSKLNYIETPSIFDIEKSDKRILLIFLKRFNEELSKPIEKEKEKEYLPTQKLVEYLKSEMTERIDGIIYNSSTQSKGKCYALFVDWTKCSDKKDKVLWLDYNTLEHIYIEK